MIKILLAILAFFLVVLLAPIGIIVTIIKSFVLLDKDYLFNYSFKIALSLDQFGNVVMSSLFNTILIKKSSINKFGNEDETISSVLGRNKKSGDLIYLGKRLDAWLNGIDPGHSIDSIGT